MNTLFHDRTDAGRQLAARLIERYGDRPDMQVLGLPRGGVPVAFEVAQALHAPLDVLVVRKLGLPQHKEYAMGAIASGGVIVLDRDVIQALGVSQDDVDSVVDREQSELSRRELSYRDDRPFPALKGRRVILVDDGLATGSTMRAAIKAVKKENPHKLVVAVPVAAPDTCESLRAYVDELICLATPTPFRAVGLWYDCFEQTTDAQVLDLLAKAGRYD